MRKWKHHYAMLLYVYMGVSRVLLAVTNAFELEYQRAKVFSFVLVFSGITTILFLMKKKIGKLVVWIVPFGSILVLYLVQRESAVSYTDLSLPTKREV